MSAAPILENAPTTEIRREGMSWEEFQRTWAEVGPFEFINGEVIPVGTSSFEHIQILRRLMLAINLYATEHGLGEAYNEAMFIRPGAGRGNWMKGSRIPDLMFYEQTRLDAYSAQLAAGDEKRPPALIPDFVVEVVSQNDAYLDVTRKIETYLEDGVRMIWVITTDPRLITVHTAADVIQKHRPGNSVGMGDVLPGFEMALDAIFGN